MTPITTSTKSWFPQLPSDWTMGLYLPQQTHDTHFDDEWNSPINHQPLKQMHLLEFTQVTLGHIDTKTLKMSSETLPSKFTYLIHVQLQLLQFWKYWQQSDSNYSHYLGVCAKVKRLCRAMLRFMRSLRNSWGEWRGEFRGEPQGDSWMGWGLLGEKESASRELCHRASLMLPSEGLTKIDLLCGSLVQPSQSWQVVLVVHLMAAALFRGNH